MSRILADPARARRFVAFVAPPKEASVLDVWAGSGIIAWAFTYRTKEVVSLVRGGRPLAWVARRPNLVLMEADSRSFELPFPNEAFHIVTSGLPLHHIPRVREMLLEMWRVCVPGGLLAFEETVSHEQDVRARYQDRLERLRDRSHGRYFRLSELIHLLGEGGFWPRRIQVIDLQRDFNEWLAGVKVSARKVELIRRLMAGAQEADLSGLDIKVVDDTFVFTQKVAWVVAERIG